MTPLPQHSTEGGSDPRLNAPHRLVIVGGGAGGLPLACRLGDKFGRSGAAEITLVDQFATHVWKPLLHEVAAGRMDVESHNVDYLTLAHWHHFRFRQGAILGLDRARRLLKLDAVKFDNGDEILPPRSVPYDTLIFCVGSVSNDFGVPGVVEHAISLDTAGDAERFHRLLLAVCVRADSRAATGGTPVVNIVIIGAGATGVELAASARRSCDAANDARRKCVCVRRLRGLPVARGRARRRDTSAAGASGVSAGDYARRIDAGAARGRAAA